MSKIVLLLLLCSLYVLQVSAQSRADHEFCFRLHRDCLAHEDRVGRWDETIDSYNQHCLRIRPNTWRSISRCDMERATCILTLVRCGSINCDNVANVLRG